MSMSYLSSADSILCLSNYLLSLLFSIRVSILDSSPRRLYLKKCESLVEQLNFTPAGTTISFYQKNTYLQQNSHSFTCTNANTNVYPTNSTLRCQNLSNRCCDFTLLAVTRTTHFHLQSQLLLNFEIKINCNLIISFNILRSGPISSPSCNSQLALLLCRQPALLHVYEQQDSFLFPASCTLRKTHYVSLNHAIAVYIGRQLSDQPITQITERATGNLPGQLSLREYSPGRIFSCP